MATIDEVARLAGVSIATVSRVLNRNYPVSEKSRARVMAAVEALGYQTNLAGRMLRTNTSRTLLVAFSVLIPAFMDAVIETANVYDHTILFSYCLPHLTHTEPLKPLYTGMADGVIYLNVMLEPAVFADVCSRYPAVLCGDMRDYAAPDVHRIVVDNETMARRMTEHLLDKGCRRIGCVGVRDAQGQITQFSREREQGVRKALAARGLAPEPAWVFHGDGSFEGGRAAADALAVQTGKAMVDGLFCFTDTIAIGCIRRLSERGIRVPDDLRVAGFDDIDPARHLIPSLSTVAQPFDAMGRECVLRLVRPERYPEAGQHRIAGQLVIRESTGGGGTPDTPSN